MAFNLRNDEANRLADELAALTGETKTRAITEAVRERLARVKRRRDRDRLFAELAAIGRRCSSRPVLDERTPEEMLYDQDGLPK